MEFVPNRRYMTQAPELNENWLLQIHHFWLHHDVTFNQAMDYKRESWEKHLFEGGTTLSAYVESRDYILEYEVRTPAWDPNDISKGHLLKYLIIAEYFDSLEPVLGSCPNLEFLFLNGNSLAEKEIEVIKKMKRLKYISLSNVTLNSLTFFTELPNLEFIDLNWLDIPVEIPDQLPVDEDHFEIKSSFEFSKFKSLKGLNIVSASDKIVFEILKANPLCVIQYCNDLEEKEYIAFAYRDGYYKYKTMFRNCSSDEFVLIVSPLKGFEVTPENMELLAEGIANIVLQRECSRNWKTNILARNDWVFNSSSEEIEVSLEYYPI